MLKIHNCLFECHCLNLMICEMHAHQKIGNHSDKMKDFSEYNNWKRRYLRRLYVKIHKSVIINSLHRHLR